MGALLVRIYDQIIAFVSARRRSTPRFGSVIAVRAYDGNVLRIEDSGHVRGRGLDIGKDALFRIVSPEEPFGERLGSRVRFGEPVGFRSLSTGAFWGVNYDDRSVLNCNAGNLREWETFELEAPRSEGSKAQKYLKFGSKVAVRSLARWHGEEWYYLQYRLQTSQLCRANVQHVRGWETYAIVAGLAG